MGEELNELKSIYEDGIKAEDEGRIAEAKMFYTTAGDSGYYLAWIRLADILEGEGKMDEARNLYEEAYRYAPDDKEIWKALNDRGITINRDVLKAVTVDNKPEIVPPVKESTPLSNAASFLMILFILQIISNAFLVFESIAEKDTLAILQSSLSLIISIALAVFCAGVSDLSISFERLKKEIKKKIKF
jgi:tetratricopeptide (TPR) repeat protein